MVAIDQARACHYIEAIEEVFREIGTLSKINLMELAVHIFLVCDSHHALTNVTADNVPKALVVESLSNKTGTTAKIENFQCGQISRYIFLVLLLRRIGCKLPGSHFGNSQRIRIRESLVDSFVIGCEIIVVSLCEIRLVNVGFI